MYVGMAVCFSRGGGRCGCPQETGKKCGGRRGWPQETGEKCGGRGGCPQETGEKCGGRRGCPQETREKCDGRRDCPQETGRREEEEGGASEKDRGTRTTEQLDSTQPTRPGPTKPKIESLPNSVAPRPRSNAPVDGGNPAVPARPTNKKSGVRGRLDFSLSLSTLNQPYYDPKYGSLVESILFRIHIMLHVHLACTSCMYSRNMKIPLESILQELVACSPWVPGTG